MQFGKASSSVGHAIMKVFLSSGTQPVRLQAGSWRASAMLDKFQKLTQFYKEMMFGP